MFGIYVEAINFEEILQGISLELGTYIVENLIIRE